MRKLQLIDLIQRVRELTAITEPIIVGSQALYAITDAVPYLVLQSHEADFMLADGGTEAIKKVNDELGVASEFPESTGYYADGLGLATVVLVPGWRDRLQPLTDEQGQVVARCLEVHDAAVSKLMAGRDYEDALPPRLRKLIEYLRPGFRVDELRSLTDLANHLSARS